MEARPVPDKDD
jgi:hypothetical protein